MIAKATDQNDVETPGVSGESIKSKQDFTEAQCDRFYILPFPLMHELWFSLQAAVPGYKEHL